MTRDSDDAALSTARTHAGRWLRDLPPLAILGAGWFGFFMYAYPGLMTSVSIDLLRQVRGEHATGDHAPMLRAIVWLTDLLVAAPTGVVIVQSVLFVAGVYLLLRRAMRARVAALAAVAVLWFPPVLAELAVMRDAPLVAGLLMLAAALLASPCRRARLGGLALVLAGTAVRIEALVATCALVVVLFEWRPWGGSLWAQRAKRYALALGAWGAITGAAFAIDRTTERAPVAAPAAIVTHSAQDKDAVWKLGVSTTVSPVQARIDAALGWLGETPLFRAWLYVAPSLALLVLALRRPAAAALLASGLGMVAVTSTAYHDAHWMICTTLVAGILVSADRRRGNPRAA